MHRNFDEVRNLYEYSVPLKNGTVRQGLILQIGDGLGEIAPLPGWSAETFDEAKEEAIHLKHDLFYQPSLPSVRFGLSCALLPFPTSIRVQTSALETPRAGFEVLKIKVGHLSVKEALERIRNIPALMKKRVDFNRQWKLPELFELASHFAPSDFAYWEEPTADPRDLIVFSEQTKFPIALDESIGTVSYSSIPSLAALVVKPTLLGAVPSSTPLIFSSCYESGIGTIHLARLATLHSPHEVHGLDPYSQWPYDLLSPTPSLERGEFSWTGRAQLCHLRAL